MSYRCASGSMQQQLIDLRRRAGELESTVRPDYWRFAERDEVCAFQRLQRWTEAADATAKLALLVSYVDLLQRAVSSASLLQPIVSAIRPGFVDPQEYGRVMLLSSFAELADAVNVQARAWDRASPLLQQAVRWVSAEDRQAQAASIGLPPRVLHFRLHSEGMPLSLSVERTSFESTGVHCFAAVRLATAMPRLSLRPRAEYESVYELALADPFFERLFVVDGDRDAARLVFDSELRLQCLRLVREHAPSLRLVPGLARIEWSCDAGSDIGETLCAALRALCLVRRKSAGIRLVAAADIQ
ncbi:MAG: hypothetical protein H6707_02105 [Deltaproteobacteria bacterium]|nr:hypothetical protein [Deltaproteobacteria bacterium]